MDRPSYQDGLPAFDQWALAYDRWALLVRTGRAANIGVDVAGFAAYNASHFYSARCYARDFLGAIADQEESLRRAETHYGEVASCLRPVWQSATNVEEPGAEDLSQMAEMIRSAKSAEENAVACLREYLSAVV